MKLHAGFRDRGRGTTGGVRDCRRTFKHVVYPFMPWWVEGARMIEGYVRNIFFTLTNGTAWSAKRRH